MADSQPCGAVPLPSPLSCHLEYEATSNYYLSRYFRIKATNTSTGAYQWETETESKQPYRAIYVDAHRLPNPSRLLLDPPL